jgi:DNA-binding IscR family transcriptional regulator
LGFKECSETNPCAIHDKWAKERERIYKLFKNINLHKIEKKLEQEINIKL